nr:MAG TPA: hypothetical protein [Bacteriophage sp.]
MLLSLYEGMLKERLKNVSSKSGYARNFIVGECYGIIRVAMADPDIALDESAHLWDMIAVELQKLSLSDFSENSELRDNMHSAMKIRELCLWGINEAIDEYREHEYDHEYCQGLIDGLIMYCDIYCDCPEELDELKEKRNKEIYEKT